ncbi:MAG: trigger factor [Oscillospiraceae bacterium]|jgi:trigger factor|nr:trigger factor [Oscillospiraceae bacterium]
MNVVAFEKKEKGTAELKVGIEAAVFNSAVDSVYKKTRGKISVPGFRPGKAPRKIIENIYGASVFRSDALDELLPQALEFGIKENDLRTVGYPRLGDVDIADGGEVTVTFTVSLYPEIEIGDYKGLHASKPSTDVPESAVDSEIEGLRLRNASIEVADRPAIKGDTVLIDYAGSVDGTPFDGGTATNYELELGSGSFIPGFEEKLEGMKAGETRDIDVVFPEEYHAKELSGKAAVFNVTVHEVRTKVLPEADDEFAKDVSEFDTIAEYRADIRKHLEEAREKDAADWFENALLDALSETVTGEIPEEMIEEQVDSSLKSMQSQLSQYGLDPDTYFKMSGMTMADYRRDSRAQAEKQVKVSLALEKIAEKEGFDANADQIEQFYTETAERYGVDAETVKKSVDEESAKREVTMRAAVKLVVDSGIAEAVSEKDDAKDGADKPKRARRATTKKDAKADDAEAAPAEKKPAKKAKAGTAEPKNADKDADSGAKKPAKAAAKSTAAEKKTAEAKPEAKPAAKSAKSKAAAEPTAEEKPKRTRAKKPTTDEKS